MSNFKFQISNGFTLIELILVMGIFSLLVSISTISLFNIQHKTSLMANVNTFTADLRQQQIKAMTAEGDGTTATYQYGIYLLAGSYVMFRGSSYSAGDANNFSVSLSPNTQFTTPNTSIIFEKGSGEISASATVTIKDTKDNSQKAITINKYGVVTGVN